MKKLLPFFLLYLSLGNVKAQTFTGQWKGYFVDKSSSMLGWGGERCDYVLELEVNGSLVTGYSYTYFYEPGKKYYTICKLKGFLKKGSKYVEVRETERTKTNVPVHIRNCFQVHRLTFFKQGNEETLEGNWIPAPEQDGDCGYGSTVLTRRVMQTSYPSFNKKLAAQPKTVKKPDTKAPWVAKNTKATPPVTPPIAKTQVKPKSNPVVPPPAVKNEEVNKLAVIPAAPDKPVIAKKDPAAIINPDNNFERRNNSLLKTIEIEHETFRVDLYDNGDIDGDTISVFYNNKLIVNNKRLSDKPISLTLDASNLKGVNELVMYAENLGSIPPNTALMVVTDGDNRYEVRITSDTQKNGTIRFTHKPRTQ